MIIVFPGIPSEIRKRVVPQSPQKDETMVLPESAVFVMVLGVPSWFEYRARIGFRLDGKGKGFGDTNLVQL